MSAPAWIEANQRQMVAAIARLKLRLAGDRSVVAQRVEPAAHGSSALEIVADLFSLSSFERDVLALCAGVEMDGDLARRCGEAHGQLQRRHATFGLALAALDDPHWSAVAPTAPLRRWRLVELDDAAGVAGGRLRIDERILHFLAGVNYLDLRLNSLVRPAACPAAIADTHHGIVQAVCGSLREKSGAAPAVVFAGDDPDGQIGVAAQAASLLGLQLHVAFSEDLPHSSPELEAFSTLWQREARLLGSALMIVCSEPSRPIVQLIERIEGMVFVGGRDIPTLDRHTMAYPVGKPGTKEQKRLWESALGPTAARLNGSLDGAAAQFRLSARTIHATAARIRHELAASDRPERLFWRECRRAGGSRLDDLAQRLDCTASWDDLVLPEPQRLRLEQIAADVRHRLTVYEDWGFISRGVRGLGMSALFVGESGTGKTMAAEVLAGGLNLDLYRVDLSSVVSKYIGETEKNLRRVFDAAEDSGAVLLFDEADALFGKRSEVKDSHDRYANIEVSYLLQRMEAYRGLAILTTNLKSALDSAFQRRLRHIVQFPFPDIAHREAIWRVIFPGAAPVEDLDYGKLARLNVSGGGIRNIALNAAFLAAGDGRPVSMAHLLRAAHSEAAKRDRPPSDAEVRGWV